LREKKKAWDEAYVSSAVLRDLNLTAQRGDKILLQFDLVQLLGGGLSSLNASELASALNSSLATAINGVLGGLPANGTVNVAALLGSLGINVPPNFCVSPINTTSVSFATLCANNASLVQSLAPNATVNLEAILSAFNISLPTNNVTNLSNISFSQICNLNVSATNFTFDVSNLTQAACFGGFNLSSVPAAQTNLLLGALSLGNFGALIQPKLEALLRPSFNLTIWDGVEAPDGKWPGALGNVMYLDMPGIPRLLSQMLPQNTDFLTQVITIVNQNGAGTVNVTGGASLTSIVRSVETLNLIVSSLKTLTPENMPHYALLAFVMVQNRYPIYLQDADASSASFTAMTNEISNRLGFNFSVTPSVPVQGALAGIRFIKVVLVCRLVFFFFSF
jgi:hypothetical protein